MARVSKSTRVRPDPSERVEVQIMGPGFLDVVHARDISLGGVGVWIPHGFEGCDISAPVELVLTLPRRKSFLVRGTIKHRTSEDIRSEFFGVEFTALPPQHRKVLPDYIARCLDDDPERARTTRPSREPSG